MTPKEKAKELVSQLGAMSFNPQDDLFINNEIAKSCANIVVREVLGVANVMDGGFSFEKEIEYWNDVETEINKL